MQNVLALCHQGDELLELEEWQNQLARALSTPGFEAVLGSRLTRGKEDRVMLGGSQRIDSQRSKGEILGGRGVGEAALTLDSILERLNYIGGKDNPPDL